VRIQACEEGRHLVGKKPIALVLYEGRYQLSYLSEEEGEALLKGELPAKPEEG
jgi:hypothetical protein